MLIEVVEHSLLISAFVFLMMLVVEYLNVASQGAWKLKLAGNRWRGYLLALLLGLTPGCLGAFAVVVLYGHGLISVGALVAAMIATSGDEAFVMLAMFPGKALLIMGILGLVGLLAGLVTDLVRKGRPFGCPEDCQGLELHEEEECDNFSLRLVGGYWRELSLPRGVLVTGLVIFVFGLLSGKLGGDEWGWVRGSLLFASGLGVFIVSTVPEHFLEEHLWKHVAREHLPRVFLWTLGALLATHLLLDYLEASGISPAAYDAKQAIPLIILACLVGLIPESGPQLIFVTLFAQGTIPLSVLLANSVVQDGHGMLPLLAHSRRDFIGVKSINLAVGIAVGLIGFLMGW
jgi:hypothetical protein